MQYIAVFTLFSIPVARGFSSLKEAVDCLDQAYADSDSSPLGIYDVRVDEVIPYQSGDYPIETQEENLIMTMAQSYITRVV